MKPVSLLTNLIDRAYDRDLNRLHGPPKKSKFPRHEGLKGLRP